jgi:hypothetical protein
MVRERRFDFIGTGAPETEARFESSGSLNTRTKQPDSTLKPSTRNEKHKFDEFED